MKWILFSALGLALVVGLVLIIGSLLPKAHHTSRKAKFHQPPETLYAVIAGPPDWRSDVKAYGALPPEAAGKQQWWEQDSDGKKITYELLENRPPVRRALPIATTDLPFGGTWTFDITPSGGGSEVRIREDGEVYNVFFRFMSHFVFGYSSTIQGFLRDLGKKLGEPVDIEA